MQRDLEDAQTAANGAEVYKATVREQTERLAGQQSTILSAQRSLKDAEQAAEELRAQLRVQTEELEGSRNDVLALEIERSKLARELRDFTEDLKIHRRESYKFGSELAALRDAQAAKEATYADEVGSLNQQLSGLREELLAANQSANEARGCHERLSRELATLQATSQDSSVEQRQKYKVQTRRLSAQIEYLKAKYTRENTFRNALALQKRFLLLLVGGMSLT